jgi:hypothetical protein
MAEQLTRMEKQKGNQENVGNASKFQPWFTGGEGREAEVILQNLPGSPSEHQRIVQAIVNLILKFKAEIFV